ncbi:glycoside hydrolase family 2 TIM barrel-domain containing protein [Aurantiacibacter suaedae]|uniref:glycoside hydrolase family 2 TIM barrel-domain containing protein n=1 Tax=Aurantiacibacter suaedae TaxID=2545755 RepID=UPI001F4F67DC|nr:glycoside hydrolase family 2 TIM barrel-domain containing protein [Aurantiacibacter suaedae]
MVGMIARNALIGVSIIGLAIPSLAASQENRPSLPAASADKSIASPQRQRIELSDGWQFNLVGPYSDDGALDFPQAEEWETVSIPHSWNRVGYYLSDPETHINTPENIEKTQGVGYYYKTFDAPQLNDGQRMFLEFDAVSRTGEVWLNGEYLGGHRNPFGRFRLDATALVKPGEANELYVKVDNTQPAEGNSTADVLPMTGDFFVRGGIYRPVTVVVTEPVHFDMLDYGGPGVYAATTDIVGGDAEISLSGRVTNSSGSDAAITVVASLLDDQGEVVGSWQEEAVIAPGATSELEGSMRARSPRLWDGLSDPYLHTLRYELRAADGTVLDTIEQAFGIRKMELDPEHGFLLNGRPYRLVGAGFHQDTEESDWAVSPEQVDESLRIMLDMGANSLRLSHYQHGSPVHDLADKYGIVLWSEIGLVTAWTNARDQVEAPQGIVDNARQQLLDLVHQNYNHASVAAWGIANEVDFGPGRPDFLGRPPEVVADPMPLLNELADLSRDLDPHRPVVLANCCEDRGMVDVPVVAEAVDAVGANRYYGWYYGEPGELGEHLDGLRLKHPEIPLSVSEYGAGGAPNMHTDDPLGGPIDMAGRTQPEEFLTWFHEENWRELAHRDYLWGIWLWNAFDFGTTVRAEGDAQDINTKGLVTYDRDIRKDAFYFYRAIWSDQPTVHVQGRRYVDRAYSVTDVRVNSNAPSTTLIVNGSELAPLSDCDQNVCVWQDVRLAAGENAIVARGSFDGGPVEDAITWQLDEEQHHAFRIDSGAVVAASAEVQFGSDDFFVGGTAGSTDQRGGRGRQAVFADIENTDRRDIVSSFRQGDFSYRIPAEEGRYRVTLTFVEPGEQAGARVFNVSANGETVLPSYDINQRAGGTLKAVSETFDIAVDDGGIELDFSPVQGQALVSAIEIVPQD